MYVHFKDVAFIVRAAFPSLNLQKAQVLPFRETFSFNGNFWDGGSRKYYAFVELSTTNARVKHFEGQNPLHDPYSKEIRTSNIPPNVVVVVHNIFCGKDYCEVYAHPEVLTPLLPKQETLSWAEEVVLVATRNLKSSYGGVKNFRYNEARQKTKITIEEWEAAKANCIQRGFLNKAGAITVEGRNVCPNKDVWSLKPKDYVPPVEEPTLIGEN